MPLVAEAYGVSSAVGGMGVGGLVRGSIIGGFLVLPKNTFLILILFYAAPRGTHRRFQSFGGFSY